MKPANEKRWMPVFQSLDELIHFNDVSAGDVTEIIKALEKDSASQSLRRTAVRNFAAHVEGVVYMTKRFTLALSTVGKSNFSKRDLARLAEETSYLEENNQQKELGRQKFLDNFKFAAKTYAHVNGFSFKLKCDDRRYEYFREMVKVRDRLMHPKSLKDFYIADEEFIRVGNAWGWYKEQVSKLFIPPASSPVAFS